MFKSKRVLVQWILLYAVYPMSIAAIVELLFAMQGGYALMTKGVMLTAIMLLISSSLAWRNQKAKVEALLKFVKLVSKAPSLSKEDLKAEHEKIENELGRLYGIKKLCEVDYV